MKIFFSQSNNIFSNISLDEALLKYESINDEILFLYQNQNTVVVGRNQNIYEIINHDFVEKHNIHVARRISGGGSIYQDMGNVGFSFITKKKEKNSIISFIMPLINFLNSIKLKAKIVKNVIKINGFVVSMITQYEYHDRILNHGTLFFKSNISMLERILISGTEEDKKIRKFHNHKITNISSLLKKNCWTTKTFIIQLTNFLQKNSHTTFKPSNEVLTQCKKIYQKISSWEWNYGPSPRYDVCNSLYLRDIKFKVLINLYDKNKIKEILFRGNFLSRRDTEDISNSLKDVKYSKKEISKKLSDFNLLEYFGSLSKSKIISTILQKKQ